MDCSLRTFFSGHLDHVEDILHKTIHDSFKKKLGTKIMSDEIRKLLSHPFKGRGKRLRPLLTLTAYHLVQDVPDSFHYPLLEIAASGIECIHIASLLHDDVLDESDIRRKWPTVRNIWGNTASILLGDFFFSEAFSLFLKIERLDILSIIANTAKSLTQGEIAQLFQTNQQDIDINTYLSIIDLKTASLFESAMTIGGLLGGLPEEALNHRDHENAHVNSRLENLRLLGYYFGRAFQMLDDLLDYVENPNSPSPDFLEKKITLPLLLACHLNPKIQDEIFLDLGNPNQYMHFLSIFKKLHIFEECYIYIQRQVRLCLRTLENFASSSLYPFVHEMIEKTFARSTIFEEQLTLCT